MSKPVRIKALETFASQTVGDDTGPRLYFVTDQGVVVTITRDFALAYQYWCALSRRSPRVESALEDRHTGVLASVEPVEKGSSTLEVRDDAHRWLPEHVRRAA